MEVLLIDIGATCAALLGHLTAVIWDGMSRGA